MYKALLFNLFNKITYYFKNFCLDEFFVTSEIFVSKVTKISHPTVIFNGIMNL